jgi:hypothetical protein
MYPEPNLPLATCNVSEHLSVKTLSAHDECTSAMTVMLAISSILSNRPRSADQYIIDPDSYFLSLAGWHSE